MRKLKRVISVLLFLLVKIHSIEAQSMWFSSGNTALFTDSSALVSIHGNAKLSGTSSVKNLGEIQLSGSLTNASSENFFSEDDGLLTLNGTTTQFLNGTLNFHNLTLNNAAGAEQESGTCSLTNTLLLQSGTLTSNDSFYLKSDSTRTARVAESIGGNTSGKFIVERFISTGVNQWRMICAPVQNTTLQDWINDFYTSGFPGSQFPNFPFVSEVFYNETSTGDFSSGYENATSSENQVTAGQGVWAYLGPLPLTFDAVGELNHGFFDFEVSHTIGSAGSAHDGWNLLGNPYASTIDWDAAGWTKYNINNAIYIWDGQAGQFRSYINGVGTNGGNALIPSSQAFFVQTNGSSPILTCDESVKSSIDAPFIYKSNQLQLIRFKISAGSYQDETVVRFHESASTYFDPEFDAGKTANQNTYSPSIFTSLNSEDYSINSLKLPDFIEIPIRITSNWTFLYDFEITELQHLPSEYCFQLIDLDSNKIYPIDTNFHLQLSLNAGSISERFILRGKKILNPNAKQLTCPDDSSAAIEVAINTNDTVPYLFFRNGNLIETGFASEKATFQNLTSGQYEFKTQINGCAALSSEIEINRLDSISVFPEISSDFDNNTISVLLNISGGTAPYQTFWYSPLSTIGNRLFELWADTFRFYILDANDCAHFDSLIIESFKPYGNSALASPELSIYPNPSASQIKLKGLASSSEVTIYNSIGVQVFNSIIQPNQLIEIDHLPQGEYILKVISSTQVLTEKFIKQF